jgi:Na+/melibiose symporter-like transporter
MKPWIAISAPLSMIIYLLLWFKSGFTNQLGLIVWYTFLLSSFYTIVTVYKQRSILRISLFNTNNIILKGFRVPFTSMTMYLSKSLRKRELATACRMGFEMAGILIALILQGVIIGNKSERCISLNQTEIHLNSSIETLNSSVENNDFKNFYNSQKYLISAIIVIGIYLFSLILFFIGTKENTGIIFISFFSKKEIQHYFLIKTT